MNIILKKHLDWIFLLKFITPLIILDRFLYFVPITIDGIKLNCYCIIIFVYFFTSVMLKKMKFNKFTLRILLLQIFCVFYYLSILIFKGLDLQAVYAISMFVFPILYIYNKKYTIHDFDNIVKTLMYIMFGYSIIYIISCIASNDLMQILGMETVFYTNQTRGFVPIGGAIAMGTLLNFMLPFNIYIYNKEKKISYFIFYLINVIGTAFTLSRSSVLIAVFIICFLNVKMIKNIFNRKHIFVKTSILIVTILYVGNNFDFSRIIISFDSNHDASTSERFNAQELGIDIFKDNIMFGSGMGKVYKRAYTNKYIRYENKTGLIDPHNSYIMSISEGGIFGLIFLLLLFTYVFLGVRTIKNKEIKKLGFSVICVALISFLGGTYIYNDPKVSSIMWLSLSLILNYDEKRIDYEQENI